MAQQTKASVKTITDKFVQQFYSVLTGHPHYVHRFYESTSRLTINESKEDGSQVVVAACNLEEINSAVMRFFSGATVRSLVVCPQVSTGEGIVLLVTGEMSRKGKPDCSFSQSFFLATQKKTYILNDILRLSPLERLSPAAQPCKSPTANGKVDVSQLFADKVLRTHSGPLVSSPIRSPFQSPPSCSPTQLRNAAFACKDCHDAGNTVVNPPQTPKRESGRRALPGRVSPPRTSSGSSQSSGSSPSGRLLQRTSSVFVRGIPEAADERALEEAFGAYGRVREGGVTIKGRKDRFGFVEFESVSSVETVLNRVVRVNGCELVVEEMRPMVLKLPGKAQVKRSNSWSSRHQREFNTTACGPYKMAGNPFRGHRSMVSYDTPIRCD